MFNWSSFVSLRVRSSLVYSVVSLIACLSSITKDLTIATQLTDNVIVPKSDKVKSENDKESGRWGSMFVNTLIKIVSRSSLVFETGG